MIYGLLEAVRSRILVRTGLEFDEQMSSETFGIVFDANLVNPKLAPQQALRDIDVLREFISGGAIVALCDAPWVPIFITACFLLHPILGFVALFGAIIIFILAALNEFLTRRRLSEANRLSIQSIHHVDVG